MKCCYCQRKAEFTCPCNFTPLCPEHLSSHLNSPGSHSVEHLSISLTNSMSQDLKNEALERIRGLELAKKKINSISKIMIKKIVASRCAAVKELNNLTKFYISLISFEKISSSLKTEVEKVLATCLRIKDFNVDVNQRVQDIFPQELVSYGDSENVIRLREERKIAELKQKKDEEIIAKELQIQGYNILDIERKRQLMDTMNNDAFNNDFGKASGRRNQIKEILFTKDGKYSFVCNNYLEDFPWDSSVNSLWVCNLVAKNCECYCWDNNEDSLRAAQNYLKRYPECFIEFGKIRR